MLSWKGRRGSTATWSSPRTTRRRPCTCTSYQGWGVTTSLRTSPTRTSSRTPPAGTSLITSSARTSPRTSSRKSTARTSSRTHPAGTSSRTHPAGTSSRTSLVRTSPRTSSSRTSLRTSTVRTSSISSTAGASLRTSPAGASSRASSVGKSSLRTSSAQHCGWDRQRGGRRGSLPHGNLGEHVHAHPTWGRERQLEGGPSQLQVLGRWHQTQIIMDSLASWEIHGETWTRPVGCGVTGPHNRGNHQLSHGIWERCTGSCRVLDTPVTESTVGGCGITSLHKGGYKLRSSSIYKKY